MTGAQWLACRDADRMLDALRGKLGGRKARLFICVLGRRAWPVLDENGRRAVEVAERLADGQCDEAERLAAFEAAGGGFNALYTQAECIPAKALMLEQLEHFCRDAAASAPRVADERGQYILEVTPEAEAAESAAQCDLLRCVFGNPFHPVALDPSWLTSTVVALARQVYESRDFGAMPILADALQDAGCATADLLDHCRSDKPHARGCWAIDLVLGKS